jgi:hypothetical protein
MTDKMTLTAGGHDFTEKGGRCKRCGLTWAEYDKSRTTCQQKTANEPIRGLTAEE